MTLLKKSIGIRISAEDEQKGIDLSTLEYDPITMNKTN